MRMGLSILEVPFFLFILNCMDFNAANIHSANQTSNSRAVSVSKVLQQGSVVSVRVTRGIGGGRYEGFVAGVKVSFTSARNLKPGDFFTATVSGNGSKILLTPNDAVSGAQIQNLKFEMTQLTNKSLAGLLGGAGLSSNNLSALIFQMFTQTGLKIDLQHINRIKNLALKFGSNSKSAAEILVMLADKDLAADENQIKQLLLQLAGEISWQENYSENQKNQEKLINRINKTKGAWFILPFELIQYKDFNEFNNQKTDILGHGNIRLLFDNGKLLKLLNLDCAYNNQKYLFNLNFEHGKCKSIRFNTEKDEAFVVSELKKRFLIADIPVSDIAPADFSDIEGNASALENVYTFGGEV